MSELTLWQGAIQKAESKFQERNIHNLVSYPQEASFASQAIKKNSYLAKIAEQRPDTLIDAVINIASIGLSLNPATQYAYLVPRDGVCCLDISYKGLIKLATDSGSIEWAKADLVYEKDSFDYKGPSEKPEHSANVFSSDRGEFVGVYCIAKTSEGDFLTEVMTAEEIYEIRNKSMAYVKSNSGPWVEFFGEMAKKSIIKRASKTWPKSDKNERLQEAIKVINEHEGIDFGDMTICGMRIDEMVDMDNVDKEKVEELYNCAVKLVEDDDMDIAPDEARDIQSMLNNDELIVFEKLLSRHKHNRKSYKTIFNAYTEVYNDFPECIEAS